MLAKRITAAFFLPAQKNYREAGRQKNPALVGLGGQPSYCTSSVRQAEALTTACLLVGVALVVGDFGVPKKVRTFQARHSLMGKTRLTWTHRPLLRQHKTAYPTFRSLQFSSFRDTIFTIFHLQNCCNHDLGFVYVTVYYNRPSLDHGA